VLDRIAPSVQNLLVQSTSDVSEVLEAPQPSAPQTENDDVKNTEGNE